MLRSSFFVLVAVALLVCAMSASANILTNGTFEGGTTAGWTKWWASWSNSSAITATAAAEAKYTGNYGMKLQINGFSSAGVYQQVAVTPGERYILSGMWKGMNASGNWFEVLLLDGAWSLSQADDPALVEANLIAGYDGGFGYPPPATFGWEPFSATYAQWPLADGTRVASGSVMTVVLKIGGSNPYAYFDDVSLELVPEPSSLFALATGLGALGFIRRKR